MKVAAIALAVTAAIAQAQAADIQPLILGGTVVPAGTKTYQVGLRATATSGSECGGVLITPTHVLTAAHCAGFAKFIAAGTHFLSGDKDGERIAIKQEIPHPKYSELTNAFDVMVTELATPSKFPTVKLSLADPETLAGKTATTIGWGTTSSGGAKSNELLRVDVPVLSNAQCKKMVGASRITPEMFCAGGEKNKDSCQGDSGGPLLAEKPTGDEIIGVVSWGDGCGVAGKPGVYAKVGLFKDWILSHAPNATFV